MHKNKSLTAIINKLDEFVRDFTGLGSPLILAALAIIVFGWTQNTFTMYLIWIANEVFCSLIKYYFFTDRPEKMAYSNWWEKIEAGSFPSIHASRWMSFAAFAVTQNIPGTTSLILLILAVVVGLTRIILRKHRWYDVSAGWVIGFLFGWVVGMM